MTRPVVVEFHVLGPLQVLVDGAEVRLGGPKQRAVLGALLVSRGRAVSTESLAQSVWTEDPPPDFLGSLQVSVSALRRILSTAGVAPTVALDTVPAGYRITVPDSSFDLTRFRALRAEARAHAAAQRFDLAALTSARALAEWRGDALQDLGRFPFAAEFAVAMEQERLAALGDHIDAELKCGRHATVLPALLDLTARLPFQEQFWGQLAIALYRGGRQAEALDALRKVRGVLADELGIDPGPGLRDVEKQILQQTDVLPSGPGVGITVVERPADARPTGRLISTSGLVTEIPTAGLRIGRSTDNDLVIVDEKASRFHASIDVSDAGLVIADLHSTNGTWVNAQRVVGGYRLLADADLIRVGAAGRIGRSGLAHSRLRVSQGARPRIRRLGGAGQAPAARSPGCGEDDVRRQHGR